MSTQSYKWDIIRPYSEEGIAVDPDKVNAIMESSTPNNAKVWSRFLGQIRWQSQMIYYLADVAIPLHTAVHRVPFQWKTVKQDAYDCLKKMLIKVWVRQPPDWEKSFHLFVDASDMAIASALMQLSKPNRYQLVSYASWKLSTVERNYSTTERWWESSSARTETSNGRFKNGNT